MPTHATPTDTDAPPPATARIIAFPVKTPAATTATTSATAANGADSRSTDAQDRLARALASLDTALSEQRAAMAGWRESMDHLRKATTGLGLSMQRYHRTLGKLGTEVSDLHAQATRLERWADQALETAARGGTAAALPVSLQPKIRPD